MDNFRIIKGLLTIIYKWNDLIKPFPGIIEIPGMRAVGKSDSHQCR